MASILTHTIIKNAEEQVDTYITTANGLYDQLNTIITNLTSSSFTGDASDGYKEFYTTKVVPALTENLTDPSSSLTASIKQILEDIQAQLLDSMDPQLGDFNKDPGSDSQ